MRLVRVFATKKDENVYYIDDKIDSVIKDLSDKELRGMQKFKSKDVALQMLKNAKEFDDLFITDYSSSCKKIYEELNLNYRNAYRNMISHHNVVANIDKSIGDFLKNNNKPMSSYFELYQYLIQREVLNNENINETDTFIKAKEYILSKNTYSKDLLHILNMPFAYNQARYKNLTIEQLFYDKYSNIKIK